MLTDNGNLKGRVPFFAIQTSVQTNEMTQCADKNTCQMTLAASRLAHFCEWF